MGKPGDWMPVAHVTLRQCPDKPFDSQPSLDVKIFRDIEIVIEANEFVMSHLPKGCKGDQDEEETNKEFQERRGGQKEFCLKRMVPIGRC